MTQELVLTIVLIAEVESTQIILVLNASGLLVNQASFPQEMEEPVYSTSAHLTKF